jgi:hypothetical protein
VTSYGEKCKLASQLLYKVLCGLLIEFICHLSPLLIDLYIKPKFVGARRAAKLLLDSEKAPYPNYHFCQEVAQVF